MNRTIIILELITLQFVNFSPAWCGLPTFGRINIDRK